MNAPLEPTFPYQVTYAVDAFAGAKYFSVTVLFGVKAEPRIVTAAPATTVEGRTVSRPAGTGLAERVGVGLGVVLELGLGNGLGLGEELAIGVGELSAVSEMTRSDAERWHVPFQQMRMVWLPSAVSGGMNISFDTSPFASATKE